MQTIKKQLLPIITQNNIQKALNITTEEADKKKIQAYKFETPQSKKTILTKNTNGQTTLRIQQIQPKTQTIPYNRTRKYQQTIIATSQNIIKIHNIKLKQQTEEIKNPAKKKPKNSINLKKNI